MWREVSRWAMQTPGFVLIKQASPLGRSNTDHQIRAVFGSQCLPARRQRRFVLRRHSQGRGVMYAVLIKEHAADAVAGGQCCFAKVQRAVRPL